MLIILGTVYGGTCMREPYSDIFIPHIKPFLSETKDWKTETEVRHLLQGDLLGAPAVGLRREGTVPLGHLEPDRFRAIDGLRTAQ